MTTPSGQPAPPAETPADCTACGGKCCRYVTVHIPAPHQPIDVDEVRWFLAHDNIHVFIDDGAWFVRFFTPCRHLTPASQCSAYANRPLICHLHQAEGCEGSSLPQPDTLFTTRDQFDGWLKERRVGQKIDLRKLAEGEAIPDRPQAES